MNNKNMADFICEARKSKGMTQRQLAEKLNITDKAVSKWERGLGYPDISILSPLAEALDVTVNELLNGERIAVQPSEEKQIVETALQYANKATFSKKESLKSIAKIAITVTCLIAICICTICDMAISGGFTWSRYPIAALVFFWLIIIPLFQFKKNSISKSLVSLSIFIIPFLVALNKIIGNAKFLLPIGIPVSLVAMAYLWSIYFLFSVKKSNRFNAAAISVLLGMPASLIINYIVVKFTKQPIINIWNVMVWGIQLIISILLFFIGRSSVSGNKDSTNDRKNNHIAC